MEEVGGGDKEMIGEDVERDEEDKDKGRGRGKE